MIQKMIQSPLALVKHAKTHRIKVETPVLKGGHVIPLSALQIVQRMENLEPMDCVKLIALKQRLTHVSMNMKTNSAKRSLTQLILQCRCLTAILPLAAQLMITSAPTLIPTPAASDYLWTPKHTIAGHPHALLKLDQLTAKLIIATQISTQKEPQLQECASIALVTLMPLTLIFKLLVYALLPHKVESVCQITSICQVTQQNNNQLTQLLASIVNLMEAPIWEDASYLALSSLMYAALGKLARLSNRFQ